MASDAPSGSAGPDLLGPVVVGRQFEDERSDEAGREAWEVVQGAAILSDEGALGVSDSNDETEALVAKPDSSDAVEPRDCRDSDSRAQISLSVSAAVAVGVLSGLLLAVLAVLIVGFRAGGISSAVATTSAKRAVHRRWQGLGEALHKPPQPEKPLPRQDVKLNTVESPVAAAAPVDPPVAGASLTLGRPLADSDSSSMSAPQPPVPVAALPPASPLPPVDSDSPAASVALPSVPLPVPSTPSSPPSSSPLPPVQPPQQPMTGQEKEAEVPKSGMQEVEQKASMPPSGYGTEVLVASEGDWVEDVIAGRDPLYGKMMKCIASAPASDANRRRKLRMRRRMLEAPRLTGGGHSVDNLTLSALVGAYADIPTSWFPWLSGLEKQRRRGPEAKKVSSPLERMLGMGKPKKPKSLPPLSPADEELARSLRTTWRCQEAHNGRGKVPRRLACLFRNLYVEAHGRESFFIAHALKGDTETSPPLDEVRKAEIVTGNAGVTGNAHPPLRWEEHNSLQELAEAIRLKEEVKTHHGISLAIHAVWHFNIGHAMFDGLYPNFLSLVQFARQDEPFRTIVINGREGPVENTLPGSYAHVEETLGVIGGLGHLLLRGFNGSADRKAEAPLHRLEEAIIGRGLNGQKLDVNANMSLGGCRLLDGCRAFRRHVFSSVGLPQPRPARSKPPFRVIVVQNKRYGKGMLEKVTEELQKDPGLSDFHVDFVNWSPNRPVGANPSLQTGNFTRHMEIIANTDIHISGPGTGQMYQTFLPDGAVHVNLGDVSSGQGYMEEYMAEGSPYFRALYYKRRRPSEPFLDRISLHALLNEARGLLEHPLEGTTPISSNLSPVGKVFKAYCHLRHREQIAQAGGQLVPLREIGIPPYLGNHFPEEYVYGQSMQPQLTACLLKLLRASFDKRHPNLGIKKGLGWFGTSGEH